MWRSIVTVSGLVALASCASAAIGRPIGHAAGDALFAPEIVAARVEDAYQAVLRLRPAFMQHSRIGPATPGGPTQVEVFLDDVDLGGVEALHQVPLDAVTQIRYVPPLEAEMRWGGPHPAGVILVSTQSTPP